MGYYDKLMYFIVTNTCIFIYCLYAFFFKICITIDIFDRLPKKDVLDI